MRLIRFCLWCADKAWIPLHILSSIVLILTVNAVGNFSPILIAPLFLSLSILILRIVYNRNRKQFLIASRLYSFVFAFHVLFVCFLFNYYIDVYGRPYEYGGTDDYMFERRARALMEVEVESLEKVQRFLAEEARGTFNRAMNYVLVITGLNKFTQLLGFEPHTLNTRILNSFCLAWIALLVWRLCQQVTKQQDISRFAGILCGVFPHMVFESAHVYRDAIFSLGIITIVTMITLFFRDGVKIKNVKDWRRVLLYSLILGLSTFVVVNLRQGFTIVAALLIFSMMFMGFKSTKSRMIAIGLGCVCMVGLLLVSGEASNLLGGFTRIQNLTARYYEVYTDKRSVTSNVGVGARIYQLPIAISIPLRLVYASLSPIPFPSPLLSDNYHRFGTVIWFFCLPFLLQGLYKAFFTKELKNQTFQIVSIAFIFLYLVVAIITTQTRQATMYIPLGCVLIAYTMGSSRTAVLLKMGFMALLGLTGLTAYLIYYSSV